MKFFRFTFILFSLLMAYNHYSNAQDAKVKQYLKDTGAAIDQKKYQEAQSSLQMAINEVNMILGKQILAGLPLQIGTMKADTADDVNGSGLPVDAPGSGLTVSREYNGTNEKSATVAVTSNAAAASSAAMVINNPSMIDQAESGEKVVTVGEYKGLLTWDDEEKSGDIQIPIGNSVVSVDADGFDNGEAIVSFASKIDINRIKKLLGEK